MIRDNLSKGNSDFKDGTVNKDTLLLNKIAYSKNGRIVGEMPDNKNWNINITPESITQTFSIPKGYHNGNGTIIVRSAYSSLFSKENLTPLEKKDFGFRNEKYALFASNDSLSIDSYNSSLTKGTSVKLSQARRSSVQGSSKNYAMIMNGYYTQGSKTKYPTESEAFNTSLTRVTFNKPPTLFYDGPAGVNVNNMTIFGGGRSSNSNYSSSNYVCGVNQSLSILPSSQRLYDYAFGCGLVSIGGYALFGGGSTGYTSSGFTSWSKSTKAYNESLTGIDGPDLTEAKWGMGTGTLNNKYGIFYGGSTSDGPYPNSSGIGGNLVSTVDVYNTSLTKTNPITTITPIAGSAIVSIDKYILVFGGSLRDKVNIPTVIAYDDSFTKTILTSLEEVDRMPAIVSTIGDYAIVAQSNHTLAYKLIK